MLEIWTTPSLGLHKDEIKGVLFSHTDVITAAFPPDGSSDPIPFFFLFYSQDTTIQTATLTCSLEGKKTAQTDVVSSKSGLVHVWKLINCDSSLNSLIGGKGQSGQFSVSPTTSLWVSGWQQVTWSRLTSYPKLKGWHGSGFSLLFHPAQEKSCNSSIWSSQYYASILKSNEEVLFGFSQ